MAFAALAWLSLAAQPASPGKPAPGAPGASPQETNPPPAGTPQGQGQAQAPAGQPGQPQSQEQQPPPRPPTFRTAISYVRVDIVVTDSKGNPVTDLQQSDFEVFEDNKPQTIDSFRLIKTSGQPMPGETPREIRSDHALETEAAREDVRLFVILFDDYHVRRGASMSVREPLTRFIRNQLGPMDLVGIAYPLTPFKDISFTRNHEGLIRAIEQFDGRKYDYQPRNQMEERYMYYPVEVVERIRNQVSLSAIRSISAGLGTMREGRKSLILISEGYTNYVPPQRRDPSAAYPGLGNPNRNNPMAGENDMNEDRGRFFVNTDLLTDMREAFNEANRANVAIYAVDPRGLAVFEFDINEGVGLGVDRSSLGDTLNSLRTLADETDGRAIVNRNDLDVGMKQMMRDASSYYLIGYNSSQAPTDGKFHPIKVNVKRKGVQVRARKGYWALTAEETARALTPAKTGPDPIYGKALAAIEAPNRARVVRTWIGTSRGENGKTNVTVVWEPAARVAGDRREPPAGVSVMAQGNGTFFRGKAPDAAVAASTNGGTPASQSASNGAATGTTATPAATAASTLSASRGGRVTFAAAPGALQVRLSVEGAGGQVLDSDFRDVVIPDYAKPEPTLSEPSVFRARTQRDLVTLAADPQAMPTTSREFSRTERLLIRVAAYAPGGSNTAPTLQLLNRDGTKMSDLVVEPFAEGGEGVYQAKFSLAGLPAGEFIIQVSLGDGGQAKQLVGLRVTS
jgi:VWFA-related protein